jgi:hypothetical protein
MLRSMNLVLPPLAFVAAVVALGVYAETHRVPGQP